MIAVIVLRPGGSRACYFRKTQGGENVVRPVIGLILLGNHVRTEISIFRKICSSGFPHSVGGGGVGVSGGVGINAGDFVVGIVRIAVTAVVEQISVSVIAEAGDAIEPVGGIFKHLGTMLVQIAP